MIEKSRGLTSYGRSDFSSPAYVQSDEEKQNNILGKAFYLQRMNDICYTEDDLRYCTFGIQQIREKQKRINEIIKELSYCEENKPLFQKMKRELSKLQKEVEANGKELLISIREKIYQMYHVEFLEDVDIGKDMPP